MVKVIKINIINWWKKFIYKFQYWYENKTCPHNWRPAVIKNQPGEICQMCDRVVVLTESEYYTKYSELGYGRWKNEKN